MAWTKKGERPAIVGTRVRKGPTGREQIVRSSGWQWSDEAEEIFLDTLASTCNVSLAADAAGFSTPTVYRQRRLRPDFHDKWQAAIVQGYARLEAALIEAANASLAEPNYGAVERPMPRMTVAEAMNLLNAHRNEVLRLTTGGTRGGPGRLPRRRDLAEVRDSIMAKIEAIARHADGEGGGVPSIAGS